MHTGIHIVLGIPGPVAYQKGTTTVVTWKRLEGLSTRANSLESSTIQYFFSILVLMNVVNGPSGLGPDQADSNFRVVFGGTF